MRDFGRIGGDDRDNIEASLGPIRASLQEIGPGSADDAGFFFAAERAFRSAEVGGLSGFHFDKNDRLSLTGDDVDFAGTVRKAKAASQDVKALASQKPVGNIFALTAECLRGGESPALAKLPHNVEHSPDRLAGSQLTASSVHSITFPRMT